MTSYEFKKSLLKSLAPPQIELQDVDFETQKKKFKLSQVLTAPRSRGESIDEIAIKSFNKIDKGRNRKFLYLELFISFSNQYLFLRHYSLHSPNTVEHALESTSQPEKIIKYHKL